MTDPTAGHSPGPWRAIPVTARPDEHAWHVVSEDENCFAVVLGSPAFVEANARLIALAPVMRDALERIAAEGPSAHPEPGDAGDTEEAEAYGAAMTAWEHAAIAREALAS